MNDNNGTLKQGNRSRFAKWGRFFLGFALLFLLVIRLDRHALAQAIAGCPPRYWSYGILTIIAGVFVSSFKLRILLNSFGIDIGLPRLTMYHLIGIFWNNFLPTTIGGDIVKFAYLHPDAPQQRTQVAVAIFTSRWTNVLVVLVTGAFVMAISRPMFLTVPQQWGIWSVVVSGLLGILMLCLVPPVTPRWAGGFTPRVARVISIAQKAHSAQSFLGRNPKSMILALLSSGAFVLLCILTEYVFIVGMGFRMPLLALVTTTILISTVSMLPISMNGLGLREWAHVYLLGKWGIPPEAATAISLMVYFSVLIVSLAGGLFFMLRRHASTLDSAHGDPWS